MYLNKIYKFDTENMTWVEKTAYIGGKMGLQATAYSGKIYYTGGATSYTDILNTNTEYDPILNTLH